MLLLESLDLKERLWCQWMAATIILFADFPVRIVVISLYWDTYEEFFPVSF